MKYLIMLALFFISLSTQAFTLNNSAKLTFNKDDVKVNLAQGLCTNIGIDDEEFLSIIDEAVANFWNKSPASRLKMQRGTGVSVSGVFHTDNICVASTNCEPNPALAVSGDILVACNVNATNFPSTAILGVTLPNNTTGTTIVGALILINDRPGNRFETKTRQEKVAIVAHEIGHAFGLGHSPVQDSLMYFATVEKRVSLGQDDMDGISYLYPKSQPVSCGTIDLKAGSSSGGNRPDWWSGLFIGFSIIAMAEIVRKKKAKKSGRAFKIYT
jgi:hypothetical protein